MAAEIQKQILNDLKSGDSEKICNAIDEMRTHGNADNVRALLHAGIMSTDEEVHAALFDFLFNVKDIVALEPILEAIKNPASALIRKELVESLWQSGLDCNGYLSFFVDLLAEQDFLVGIEAITVIEGMAPPFEEKELNNCINKIDGSLAAADHEKRKLLESVKLTLKQYLPGNKFYSLN